MSMYLSSCDGPIRMDESDESGGSEAGAIEGQGGAEPALSLHTHKSIHDPSSTHTPNNVTHRDDTSGISPSRHSSAILRSDGHSAPLTRTSLSSTRSRGSGLRRKPDSDATSPPPPAVAPSTCGKMVEGGSRPGALSNGRMEGGSGAGGRVSWCDWLVSMGGCWEGAEGLRNAWNGCSSLSLTHPPHRQPMYTHTCLPHHMTSSRVGVASAAIHGNLWRADDIVPSCRPCCHVIHRRTIRWLADGTTDKHQTKPDRTRKQRVSE